MFTKFLYCSFFLFSSLILSQKSNFDVSLLVKDGFIDNITVDERFEPDEKYIYEFNSNGLIANMYFLTLDGTDWVNKEHHITTYDSLSHISNIVKAQWIGSYWKVYLRTTYNYSIDNNQVLVLSEKPHDDGWENTYRYIKAYDNNNNLLTSHLQDWNKTNLSWKSSSLTSYT